MIGRLEQTLESSLFTVCNTYNMTIIKEISTTDARDRFFKDIPDGVYKIVCDSACLNGNLSNLAKTLLSLYQKNGYLGFGVYSSRAFDIFNRARKYPHILRQMENEIKGIDKTVPSFDEFLDRIEGVIDGKEAADGKSNKLYKVQCNRVEIVAPLNFETAKRMWGGNTDWCTSKSREDFNTYCNDSSWVFVVNADYRYQIQVGKDGTIMQFRDDCDDEIINSAEYLVHGECEGEYIEHDEFIEKLNEYKEEIGEDDDYDALWSFLESRCNYEPFNGVEWEWNFTGEFIDMFGQDAYNAIVACLPAVIESGVKELEHTGHINENVLPEDENGDYYHGTRGDWDVNKGFIEDDGAIWFADYKEYSDKYTEATYGQTIVAKLDIKNPFDAGEIDIDDDMQWGYQYDIIKDESAQAKSNVFKQFKSYAEKLNVSVWKLVELFEQTDAEAVYSLTREEGFKKLCQQAGYDSIKATESGDPTIGVFSNDQIKDIRVTRHESVEIGVCGLRELIGECVTKVMK